MKKNKFIEQLQEGERLEDVFLVKASRLSETRTGKPSLILEVGDKTGEISGPVWDNAERYTEMCRSGNFIFLKGLVQSYRDKLQLRIEEIKPIEKREVSLADFVPSSQFDIAEMAAEAERIISSLENKWVRKLLSRFFTDEKIWEKFKHAPAAKGIHHAYAGGLLEHCLSMARLVDLLANHYIGIDRSLLMAGVFFHDIGKLYELSDEGGLID